MKFKVGDRVKVVRFSNDFNKCNEEQVKSHINAIGTIASIGSDYEFPIEILFDDNSLELVFWREEELELVESFEINLKLGTNSNKTFDFYGYTWIECYEEFHVWYESENRLCGHDFYEKYPSFESALKAFRESLEDIIGVNK